MNLQDATRAILDYWVAERASVAELAPLPEILDNEIAQEPTTTWVRLAVRELGTRQETVGRHRHVRRDGVLVAIVFGAAGVGSRPATVIGSAIRSLFESRRIADGEIRLLPSTVKAADQDGDRWNVTVEIPFWYREALTR